MGFQPLPSGTLFPSVATSLRLSVIYDPGKYFWLHSSPSMSMIFWKYIQIWSSLMSSHLDSFGVNYSSWSPISKPLPEAVATLHSCSLQVGLMVNLNSSGISELQNIYAAPNFREAPLRIDQSNARIWRAQGSEFTPECHSGGLPEYGPRPEERKGIRQGRQKNLLEFSFLCR